MRIYAAKSPAKPGALLLSIPTTQQVPVYPKDILEGIVALAREHNLIIFADEIYDKILYDDVEHVALGSLAKDVLCVTF